MTPRKYRLMLSDLRAYSNVVEVKMCANKWSDIDFKLPRPVEVVDFQFRQMIENLPV